MSLAFEALRIQRVKKPSWVRILFVAYLILNLGLVLWPIGDADFTVLYDFLMQRRLPEGGVEALVSPANWLYLVSQFGLALISVLVSWVYACGFLLEWHGFNPREAGRHRPLKCFGYVLLMLSLYAGVALLSVGLFMIPYVVFSLMSFFVIPALWVDHQGFKQAWKTSMRLAKPLFPVILIALFVMNFLGNGLRILLSLLSAQATWPALIGTVVTTLMVLARGRLLALMYTIWGNRGPKQLDPEGRRLAQRFALFPSLNREG